MRGSLSSRLKKENKGERSKEGVIWARECGPTLKRQLPGTDTTVIKSGPGSQNERISILFSRYQFELRNTHHART